MQIKGIILDYNSSALPIDRSSVKEYLVKISGHKTELSSVDNKILNEMEVEFNTVKVKEDSLSYSFLNSPSVLDIFDNNRQKYLYSFTDENVSFFVDGMTSFSYRNFNGDSFDNSILLGELGMRFRGTLFENVGFYIRLSNGQQFSGGYQDRVLASKYDPRLSSSVKFLNEKNYDSFEGYLRYVTKGNWLALTVGKESMTYGFGYTDKLFLSSNTAPFDFLKLDLKYKTISYSFFYGSLKGDSLGHSLESKNIISNQISFNFDRVKFNIFESVIVANRSISFTYLNPINFLISSDFTSQRGNDNNAFLGFSAEVIPFNNLALQGTLLIDDLDFKSLFKEESLRDNKFGIQCGLIWNEFLTLPNLKFTAEYAKLNPYVYTHRTNKSTYTHWQLSLGHHIPPNSDEIIGKLDYNFSQRIRLGAEFAYQRSANGYVLNQNGTVYRNYGGDLLRGDGDLLTLPGFLVGNRTNKRTLSFNIYIEPIKQYYISIYYSKIWTENYSLDKTNNDNIFYVTIGVDF